RAGPVPRGGAAVARRQRARPPVPLLVPRGHARRHRGQGPQSGGGRGGGLMAGSGTAHLRDADAALLRVEHLVVEFPVGRSGLKVNAVSDVSLDIIEGETLGIVGESGCGKSTTGRAIVQLPPPKSGTVRFDGVELTSLKGEDLRKMRPRMQMIF